MSDNKEAKQAPAVEAASVEHGQMGWKLAMRVMQSDLFEQLDDAERAECDALVRANPYMNFRSNADSAPAPAVDAAAQDEREDFEAAMEKHGRMRPFTRWPSDDSYTDDRIEWARRGWLAALSRASEAAAGEPVAYYRDCVYAGGTTMREYNRVNEFADGGEGIPLYAAPQPASEQQPIPQVFIDNGDASRKAFGKTVFAGMSNSDDLWSVWLDGWLRASEQQALKDSDVFTLIGHAENLRAIGQSDMPAWCIGLAERIAETIGDKALAGRTRALATKGDGHAE